MKTGNRLALLATAIVSGVFAWAHWPEERLDASWRADRVVVEKSNRRLILLKNGVAVKSYSVSLGGNPTGHKQREGDQRTPEGEYTIDTRNPASSYHLALHVSYPAPADETRARQAGVSPGGEIMIHGLRNGLGWLGRLHRAADWTAGCVALTDREIEELWRAVPDGTPITLKP